MVTFYSHKLLYQSALFCSEISYSDVQKRAWFELKQIYLHFFSLIICLQKLKWAGIFETESSRLSAWLLKVGSWKLTEIKLAKKMNGGIKRHKGERREEREIQRALLADGEKCCKVTDPFLKSSAASASTSANTASTNVSDTVEPAHQGERQDSEEYEKEEDEEGAMDNCVTVIYIFDMFSEAYCQ